TLFRRNYQMLGVVFVSAFAFEMAYDTGMNKLWDSINKGRQWKDIRHRYVEED
ncbi:cytochrome b-c1 complex subunit 9, partial [Xylaria sp. FL0043]